MKLNIMRLEERIVLEGAGIDHENGGADASSETSTLESMSTVLPLAPEEADAQAEATASTGGLAMDGLAYAPYQGDPSLADAGADSGARLLVISSSVYESEVLSEAASDSVQTLVFDPATTTLDQLLLNMRQTLGDQVAESIGFAVHGTEEGRLSLTTGEDTSLVSLLTSESQQAFWQQVGDMVAEDGRIDLLACDLAATEAGQLLVEEMESVTGRNVSASDDTTANAEHGGDWILESDDIDAAAFYFDVHALGEFDGVLVAPDAPTDNDGATTDTVAEDATVGTYVGVTALSADPEGNPVPNDITYALTTNPGNLFAIDANTGEVTVAAALDYETATSHTIGVTATDGGSGDTSAEATFNIAVTDVDEAPTAGNDSVTTNEDANSVVITVDGNDSDPESVALTGFSVVTDVTQGSLVNNNDGTFTYTFGTTFDSLTATEQEVQTFTYTVSDGSLTSNEATVEITIDGVNDNPTAVTLDSNSVNQSGGANAVVGSLSADDVDTNDSHLFTFTTGSGAGDNGDFAIVGNELRVGATALDPGTYNVRIEADDQQGGTLAQAFVITVVDDVAPSAPTDIDGATDQVDEGASNGTYVGIEADSSDTPASTITYSLTDNVGATADAGGRFAIDSGTGRVTVADATLLDYETAQTHHITVQAVDAAGNKSWQGYDIAVANVAPTATDDTAGVGEDDGSASMTPNLLSNDTDPNSSPSDLSVSAVAGVAGNVGSAIAGGSGGLFTINSDGTWTFDTNGDFENLKKDATTTTSVQITVSDGVAEVTQNVTVTVTGVNDAPNAISAPTPTTTSINEGVDTSGGNGYDLGALATSDPDNGDTHTYALSGADAAKFNINGGHLYLQDGVLDYETKSSYVATVTSTDENGASVPQEYTVNVNDLNDPPTVTVTGGNASFTEDSATWVAVDSAAQVADSNGNNIQAVRATITAGRVTGDELRYNGGVVVDSAVYDPGTGTLTITRAAGLSAADASLVLQAIEFRTTSDAPGATRTVKLEAQDMPGLWGEESRGVTVTEINDAPTQTLPASITVNEDYLDASGEGYVTGISIGDVDADATADDFVVTLSVDHGTVTVKAGVTNGLAAGEITDNGTGTVTLTGTINQINATLADANGLRYKPDANYNGSDALTVVSNDQGASGTANDPKSVTGDIAIAVTPVNDGPVNTISASYSTSEDTVLSINNLAVTDIDAGSNDIQVTLQLDPGTGTLAVDSSAGTLTSLTGNGTGIVLLRGTLAQVNAVLSAGVDYTPPADWSGSPNLKMTTSDLGNTGAVYTELKDIDDSTITVSAANDAPTIYGHAMDFDGADDHILADYTAAMGTITNQITLEAWVNYELDSSPRFLVSRLNSYELYVTGGFLYAAISKDDGSGGFVYTGTTIAADTWTHIAVTYDASTDNLVVYKDGAFSSQLTHVTGTKVGNLRNEPYSTVPTNQYYPLAIGSRSTPSYYFNGEMDEVRVWSTVLAAQTIQDNMYRTDFSGAANLVAFYDFEGPNEVNRTNPADTVTVNGAIRTSETPVTARLDTIVEDVGSGSNGGNTVAQILRPGSVTDIDEVGSVPTEEALAINSVDGTNGTWQYSTNGGTSWTSINPTDLAGNNALALREAALLRFVPNADYHGDATFSYRAWDLSDGAGNNGTVVNTAGGGGTTAYSQITHIGTITVTAVNDAPTIINPGDQTALEDTAKSIPALQIADVDLDLGPTRTTYSARVWTTNINDVLQLDLGSGVAVIGGANGTNNIAIKGTAAQINDALDGLVYSNLVEIPAGTSSVRTINVEVNDGGNYGVNGTGALSTTDSFNVTVTGENDAPTIQPSTGQLIYDEGSGAVPLDDAITLADIEGDGTNRIRLQIVSNYVQDQDYLLYQFEETENIVASWDADTATLEIFTRDGASLSLAEFQTALRNVTYQNTSGTPSTLTRTVALQMTDDNASFGGDPATGGGPSTGTSSIDINVQEDVIVDVDTELAAPPPPPPSTYAPEPVGEAAEGGEGDAGEAAAEAGPAAGAANAGGEGAGGFGFGQTAGEQAGESTADDGFGEEGDSDSETIQEESLIVAQLADLEASTLESIEAAQNVLLQTEAIADAFSGEGAVHPLLTEYHARFSDLQKTVASSMAQLRFDLEAMQEAEGEVEGLATDMMASNQHTLDTAVVELRILVRFLPRAREIISQNEGLSTEQLKALLDQEFAAIEEQVKSEQTTDVGKVMQDAAAALLEEKRQSTGNGSPPPAPDTNGDEEGGDGNNPPAPEALSPPPTPADNLSTQMPPDPEGPLAAAS